VSTATVSRALNGKPTVDRDLVARVRTAAEEFGYQPNGPARNLRRQEAAVVALIISDVENPFFTAIARGVAWRTWPAEVRRTSRSTAPSPVRTATSSWSTPGWPPNRRPPT